MTKLRCLPVEATNYMVEMGGKQSLRPALTYAAMLAAATPPPPEIEEALKRAEFWLRDEAMNPFERLIELFRKKPK